MIWYLGLEAIWRPLIGTKSTYEMRDWLSKIETDGIEYKYLSAKLN